MTEKEIASYRLLWLTVLSHALKEFIEDDQKKKKIRKKGSRPWDREKFVEWFRTRDFRFVCGLCGLESDVVESTFWAALSRKRETLAKLQ